MGIIKNGFSGQGEYTASYANMRGVDFNCSLRDAHTRFAYLENMYRDYDNEAGRIESIPGFRRLVQMSGRINSLFMQKSSTGARRLIVHAGTALYRVSLDEENSVTGSEEIGTVSDFPCHAFSYGYDVYLLDGTKMWRIPESGSAIAVGSEGAMPYVPTTYNNGVMYEQLNLLTDRFKERTLMSSTYLFTYGSHEIYYRITDADKGFCAAVGISADFKLGPLHIPSYVDIGGEKFLVTEIGDGAFKNNANINVVWMNEGIRRVGREAFSGCSSLFRVIGAQTLCEIDDSAFSSCPILEHLYVGRDFERFGKDAFSGSRRLSSVYYSGNTDDFDLIENSEAIGNAGVFKSELPKSAALDIPIKTPTASIESVKVDGVSVSYTSVIKDGLVKSVMISADDRRAFEGKEIIVNGVAAPYGQSKIDTAESLFSATGYTGGGKEAVEECRICESFDGRIFLSGNPKLPNTVIYSARGEGGSNNPLYFGAFNYFNDGTGSFPVVSMLAAGDSLAIFKSDDDGGGSIFYHTPMSTGDSVMPRIYPVSYVHGGVGALGESISFFDDPVFISRNGLCALDKKTINLERSVVCRSHNVNSRLLAEDLTQARLGKWRGYLVVSVGGRMYLADSRAMFLHESGSYEYEWYYLSKIGTYTDAKRIYRYASTAKLPFKVHPNIDDIVTTTVISVTSNTGNTYYYTNESSTLYAAYPTDEYAGGNFSEAKALLTTDDDLLFFGTDDGSVCIFNNDMRGAAPPYISEDVDFDAADYKAKYGNRIHPYYYRFVDHLPTYALRTMLDNCGIPHLTKSTVKHSLAIKMSSCGAGNVVCEVGTDRSGYSETARVPSAEIDFATLNFAHLAFETFDHFTIPIAEREKSWIEKEIAISSSDGAPIAIYSMSYRFTIKGRIKRKG